MDEEGHEVSGDTHRVLQKSTGRMIGTASIYPEYLRCVGSMNTRLEHCDKLDISKDPRSRELSLGSDVRSRLKQDLLLSDSEETSETESLSSYLSSRYKDKGCLSTSTTYENVLDIRKDQQPRWQCPLSSSLLLHSLLQHGFPQNANFD